MSKKKDDKNSKGTGKKSVEFKPGNKPYCHFGKEILNKDVPWVEIIIEILDKGYNLNQIADYAETAFTSLREVVRSNYDALSFRAGARIITLHCSLYPEIYFCED
jgi:hypothetical protein